MRIALAPLNPTIGDLDANAALAADAIARARTNRADLVVLPELCICGYPPRDLLLQEHFVAACERAADALAAEHAQGLTLVIGCPLYLSPESPDAGIANALLVYQGGLRTATYHKRLLPTYDVFDEDRYFVPGSTPAVIDVADATGAITRVGLTICEDLWKGEDAGFGWRYRDAQDPVAELAAAGAQVIVSPSASPFVLGKGARHRAIVAAHALRHRLIVASVNQLGGNDELIFDGHCFAFGPDGRPITNGLLFREGVTVFDTDPAVRPRSIAEGAVPPHLVGPAFAHSFNTEDPAAPEELALFEALVLGVRDYLRKTGFSRAILGLSGGIDSALTAAIAAAAIGPSHVLGVAMPSRYSSEHSKSDAFDLAQRLGMLCITIPIQDPVAALKDAIDPRFDDLGLPLLGAALPDLAEENLQSRVRGTTLMALSNRTGAIVLTTGNKSEMSVGYATLYGDMNGGLAVLSDLPKQLVYRLARWINANALACGYTQPPIPESSISKAPSAELRPDQTDQDSLPPYDQLDDILTRYVQLRHSPGRITSDTGLPEATVRRITRLIDLSEYKRKQAATGLKVSSVAFGSGRRWPIAQKWKG